MNNSTLDVSAVNVGIGDVVHGCDGQADTGVLRLLLAPLYSTTPELVRGKHAESRSTTTTTQWRSQRRCCAHIKRLPAAMGNDVSRHGLSEQDRCVAVRVSQQAMLGSHIHRTPPE